MRSTRTPDPDERVGEPVDGFRPPEGGADVPLVAPQPAGRDEDPACGQPRREGIPVLDRAGDPGERWRGRRRGRRRDGGPGQRGREAGVRRRRRVAALLGPGRAGVARRPGDRRERGRAQPAARRESLDQLRRAERGARAQPASACALENERTISRFGSSSRATSSPGGANSASAASTITVTRSGTRAHSSATARAGSSAPVGSFGLQTRTARAREAAAAAASAAGSGATGTGRPPEATTSPGSGCQPGQATTTSPPSCSSAAQAARSSSPAPWPSTTRSGAIPCRAATAARAGPPSATG